MNAVSGSILLVLVVTVAAAPRRWALLAILAGVFFLTQGHGIDVGGLNIYPLRVLELVAFARVVVRRELRPGSLNRIDATLLLLYNYTALVWIFRSSNVTAQQFAVAVDPTLCYLAIRALLSGLEDLRWLLEALVLVLVPFAALVFLERGTGRTAFALVGADWELFFRDGVARCQGSFRHAILLGSVAASFLPLYAALWLGRARRIAIVGGAMCVALVGLSNSGGPLTSAAVAALGWAFWPLRARMRLVRAGVAAAVVVLAFAMKAPIWYLPFKVSAIVGGGGYHRGLLMDRAWHDLGKWWLFGMDIQETASWFPYVHTFVGGADVTNQFVVFGLKGGLPAIGLAVVLLTLSFGAIGRAAAGARASRALPDEFLVWGLGVTLVVHAVSWLGVSYFDQSWVIWLLHVSCVAAVAQAAPVPAGVRVAAASRGRRRWALVPAGARAGRTRQPAGVREPAPAGRAVGLGRATK